MRDDAGNVYGVSERGGDEGGGIIFKLEADGELSILHEFIFDWATSDPLGVFSSEPGGTFPFAGLVGNPAGIVYSTTRTGGNARNGIVYRFDVQSNAFDVLLTFTDAQGGFVEAPLWRDSAGALYGTTPRGGNLACNQNAVGCGTVFRLDPAQLQ
jgi:uncharacterized repeat protein (TIGR03803 family)